MLEQAPIFSVPPLRYEIFDNVTLLPMVGAITSQADTYALGAHTARTPLPHVLRMVDKDTTFYHLPPVRPWNFSSQEVIYGGIFFTHWGHFLLENLQRLWYTKQCKLPIVWCGVNGYSHTPSQLKTWQKEIFHALNIKNTHIFLTEPTQFSKVHFPEPASGINTHLHPQQAAFLGYYESTPTAGKYVYISRAKVRSCANEEALESILKQLGWQIIYPENLSVTEQLNTLSSAEVCFMIGGSAQHSLLLTKNLQTRFIIIPREHTETYNIIANSKSNNYFLFHAQRKVLFTDHRDEANDIFTLDLEALKTILAATKNFTTDLEHFPTFFSKPEKLTEKHLRVPDMYFAPAKPLSLARKLFYHAVFLYQQKKFRPAYKIFTYLRKKKLLKNSMMFDFYNALQQYHIQENFCITLPLEKHHSHIELLREKIAKEPLATRHYKKLTELLLIMGNFDAALQLQDQLLQHNPQWSKPLQQMAYICNARNDLDSAISYAEQAVDIEPHKLQRKEELASYYLKKHNYMACKKLITGTLLKFPHWDAGYLCLASVHEGQGHLDKALACVEKALQLTPNNLKAQDQLAHILRQQGQYQAAIKILAQSLQHNPRHAERHAQNARVYEHMGDLPRAITHARKAVEMEPRNFVCKAYLAEYLCKNKEYAQVRELMQDALHKNPFWSEPHAQFAAIHAAEGQLSQAIDCARKAVAIEPFNILRREELERYRMQQLQENLSHQELSLTITQRKSITRARVQSYIDLLYAQSYLEIGVFRGRTFLHIDVPFKVAVDPNFQLDPERFATDNAVFYEESSDEFFENFPQRAKNLKHKYHNTDFKFDVIFIDGLHTYEQTLKDFENTLPYSHEKTLWIIDDTVPNNCFSAIRSQSKSEMLKACAGLSKEPAWHGDVFKAVFAIHDKYPEFSYCTQVDNGNPQTILWRTQSPTKRKPVFSTAQAIEHMRYEDFIEYAWVMHPVTDAQVLGKIFTNINPLDYKTGKEHSLIISPLITDKEKEYAHNNKELQSYIAKLSQEKELSTKEILLLKDKITHLMQESAALQKENMILKKHLEKHTK